MSLSPTMIPGMLIWMGAGGIEGRGGGSLGAAGFGSFVHFWVRRGAGTRARIRFVRSILGRGEGAGFGSFVHFCVRRGGGDEEDSVRSRDFAWGRRNGIRFVPAILIRSRRRMRVERAREILPISGCAGGVGSRSLFRAAVFVGVRGRAARAVYGVRASRFVALSRDEVLSGRRHWFGFFVSWGDHDMGVGQAGRKPFVFR